MLQKKEMVNIIFFFPFYSFFFLVTLVFVVPKQFLDYNYYYLKITLICDLKVNQVFSYLFYFQICISSSNHL